MSVTIGFGLACKEKDEDVLSKLVSIVDGYGYGCSVGTEGIEEDAREGVLETQEKLGWQQVVVLRSPVESNANLAFGIHQELER